MGAASKLDVVGLIMINILGLALLGTLPGYFIVYPAVLFAYLVVLMIRNDTHDSTNEKIRELEERIDKLEKNNESN